VTLISSTKSASPIRPSGTLTSISMREVSSNRTTGCFPSTFWKFSTKTSEIVPSNGASRVV